MVYLYGDCKIKKLLILLKKAIEADSNRAHCKPLFKKLFIPNINSIQYYMFILIFVKWNFNEYYNARSGKCSASSKFTEVVV